MASSNEYKLQLTAMVYPTEDNILKASAAAIKRVIENNATMSEAMKMQLRKFNPDLMYEYDLLNQSDIGGMKFFYNSCFADTIMQTLFFVPVKWIYRNVLYKTISHTNTIRGCKIPVTALQKRLVDIKDELQAGEHLVTKCINIREILQECFEHKKIGIYNDYITNIGHIMSEFVIDTPIISLDYDLAKEEQKEYTEIMLSYGFDQFKKRTAIEGTSTHFDKTFRIFTYNRIEQTKLLIKPDEEIDNMELYAIAMEKDRNHFVSFVKWANSWFYYNDLDREYIVHIPKIGRYSITEGQGFQISQTGAYIFERRYDVDIKKMNITFEYVPYRANYGTLLNPGKYTLKYTGSKSIDIKKEYIKLTPIGNSVIGTELNVSFSASEVEYRQSGYSYNEIVYYQELPDIKDFNVNAPDEIKLYNSMLNASVVGNTFYTDFGSGYTANVQLNAVAWLYKEKGNKK